VAPATPVISSSRRRIPQKAILRRFLLAGGLAVALVASAVDPRGAASAAARTWPPFVLVVGLLLVGRVAFADGLFDNAAALSQRVGGGGPVVYLVLLGLVAVVTAVLNLDTAVVFLTPVLVLAGRRRNLPEEPFLYGPLFVANAASLFLPGSNLTNLLVLAQDHVPGAVYALRMLPAAIAATLVTLAVLTVWFRHALATPARTDRVSGGHAGWVGVGATSGAAALVLMVRSPALPVVCLGVAAVGLTAARGRTAPTAVIQALDLPVLAGLFGLAVGLGTLAGAWSGPGRLMQSANAWETAVIGAGVAVMVNNLPAAVLLSGHAPAHPRALLIGLDLGPNLAVTGSLSALLWYNAAKSVGETPSLLRVSKIGLVVVPCSMVAALGALALFAPGRL